MHMAAAIVASYSSTCQKCKAINFKVCAGADVTLKSLWATEICHGRLGSSHHNLRIHCPGGNL